MKRCYTFGATFLLTGLLAAGPAAYAQEPQRPMPMPETEEPARAETITGELLEIDPDSMTLTIRTADETELRFSYTPQTVVVGSQEGIAGLATSEGTLVTVHYEETGGTRTATRIDVDERR